MPIVGLTEDDEQAAVVAVIDRWVAGQLAGDGPLVAAERQDVTDRTASHRWYLRLQGDEKDVITVWLTLHQRTLHHETQFMPAPEANVVETYAYLMRRNADLYGMAFCLGPEDAVYLVGRVPAALVDDDELDRIAGSSIIYVDDHFPTAMTLGHPTLYRRRPRRP
ncbi:MAG TPA: YbjN domain-containing protein [Acidimicrobiales bacterium]|nr:YbjN domain-containing protein [Acidimicrobiales bacterium]